MARTKNQFNAIRREAEEKEQTHVSSGIWRTGLYARLSVDSENGKKESIENQLRIMYSFFKDKAEFTIVREYIDKGFSGTNFRRPAFEEMMEDIRSGRITCVATKDLSRLGRDYLETSNFVETIFPFLGIRYISVNDHFDTSQEHNGNKDLEIALKNLVNDMYARDVSKRLSVTRQQEQLRGRYLGSNPPYGYRILEDHPLRKLVIDPPAAEVVRSIYEMALKGMNLRSISLNLQEQRLRIPGSYLNTGELFLRDGEETQQWYIGTISYILSSQIYIGNLVQGKRRERLYKGEERHFTEKEEWVVVENTHEAIITKEVYEAVRENMCKKRKSLGYSSGRTAGIPIKPDKYAGILYCGICGKRMSYCSFVKSSDEMKRHYYYKCTNDYYLEKKEKCRVTINELVLDGLVKELLGGILQSLPGGADELLRISEVQSREALMKKEKEIRKTREVLERIDAAAGMDYEAYVLGKITKESYLEKRSEAEKKHGKQEKILLEMEAKRDDFVSGIKGKIEWLTALSCFSEGEPDRELLHLLISRIDLYPGHRLSITYPFSRTDFLPPERKETEKEEKRAGEEKKGRQGIMTGKVRPPYSGSSRLSGIEDSMGGDQA